VITPPNKEDRGVFMSQKVWNEKAETMPREKMEGLRFEKLKRQLKRSYQKSLFYRRKFDEIKVRPEDIRTWEDFRRVPVFMTKEDERASEAESRERTGYSFGMHCLVPPEKMMIVRTTSGTTGIPTFGYSYTKRDYERLKECVARIYWLASLRPGDRILNCFPALGGIHSSGGLWSGPLLRIGVVPLEVGAEAGPERALQFALLTKPTALFGSPSFAQSLIDISPSVTGKEIRSLGIQKLLLSGEPGIEMPTIRKRIEEEFGGKWHVWWALYGEACAASCGSEEYQGMHEVAPEFSIHAEDIIDPVTREPVKVEEGAIGETVLTVLDREGLSFIKYATGDVIQLFTKPCPCGYPGPGYRFKMVGRVEDMLIVEGTRVFPISVRQVISSFSPRLTGAMRIVLSEKPPKITAPLRFKVEYGSGIEEKDLTDLKREVEGKIQMTCGVMPEIELVPPESLSRSVWKTSMFERRYES
jgi:phenylacetate-CoA ligase